MILLSGRNTKEGKRWDGNSLDDSAQSFQDFCLLIPFVLGYSKSSRIWSQPLARSNLSSSWNWCCKGNFQSMVQTRYGKKKKVLESIEGFQMDQVRPVFKDMIKICLKTIEIIFIKQSWISPINRTPRFLRGHTYSLWHERFRVGILFFSLRHYDQESGYFSSITVCLMSCFCLLSWGFLIQ